MVAGISRIFTFRLVSYLLVAFRFVPRKIEINESAKSFEDTSEGFEDQRKRGQINAHNFNFGCAAGYVGETSACDGNAEFVVENWPANVTQYFMDAGGR